MTSVTHRGTVSTERNIREDAAWERRSYASNDALPAAAAPSNSLVWSEYCYLLCIAIALLLVIIPPDVNFPARRIVRQLPLLLTVPIVLLSVAGQRLSFAPYPATRTWTNALTALLPLLLLGLWIVAGSIHARVVEQWQATFLNLGIYVAAAAAAALMMVASNAPTKLAQAFIRMIIFAALVMAAGLLFFYGKRDIYHEQIFLAIPIAVTCALTQQSRLRAWAGCAFFLGLALLSMKNTSYIIAMLSLLYIAALLWLNGIERAPSLKQLWLHYLAFLSAVAVTAVVCFLLYFRDSYLPSGNVEFRHFTYRAAWQQFLDSPLWGTSFSEESIRKFTLFTVGVARNRLPTHSDIMDLLANGGLLAMAMWTVGYLRVGVFAYKRVLAPRFLHYPWAAQAHTFAMISLAAIVTYAFNPILLQPELAFMVWTTLGFLVGLAASCDPEAGAGEVARRFHSGKTHAFRLNAGFHSSNPAPRSAPTTARRNSQKAPGTAFDSATPTPVISAARFTS